jgi:A/G-specific adenine glycosylase
LNPHTFAKFLLSWADSHIRILPWKGIKDPYKIWLSEIILQQTRVDQGMPYYNKFILRYPSVHDLAQATEDDVLKTWEGLGYYSRARNLHATAKYISETLSGKFPDNYQDLLALKGIGPYTAAAISSFAYEEKKAVIDGNVQRLVSRILGVLEPIESPEVKRILIDFTQTAIEKVKPSLFNQALMDYGATVCKPKNPSCENCVFKSNCVAFQEDQVSLIPVKSTKIVQVKRQFIFFHFILPDDFTIVEKRIENDIWKNLYQLPGVETSAMNINELKDLLEKAYRVKVDEMQIVQINESPIKQKLTHRIIEAIFYKVILNKIPAKINEDQYLVKRPKISTFAFPKIITDYLKNNI